MLYQKFYEKQSNIFQIYIKNTTQKQILVKNIIAKLKSSFKLKEKLDFVFTDIGAGDGKVTIPIIKFLEEQTKLTCHVIEPSDLIDAFKQNCKSNNVQYYKQKIDEFKIPRSDFILVSHVLVYVDDYEKTIQKIYAALKDTGIALLIETNPHSDDDQLKLKLGKTKLKKFNLTSDIIKFLKANSIKHQLETVDSEIDTSGCISLNEEGKALISFFYHKPFQELTKKEITDLQNAIKELANESHKLTKKEDYVWIFK